jgi:hypothetical protein
LAAHLFLTAPDLCPLMVLLVVLTGRNIETIKELPAEHRILMGRAVELRVVKRRRGPRWWHTTVSWEIEDCGRELHSSGGLYLLVHQLTAPRRAWLQAPQRVWAIWRNAVGNAVADATVGEISEHSDPFAKSLNNVALFNYRWVAKHGLTADAVDDHTPSAPLPLDFNRLKTSIEVRHTRQMGGHLPSAVRTNTVPVLFTNYLRGDPTVIEWAHDIVSDALSMLNNLRWPHTVARSNRPAADCASYPRQCSRPTLRRRPSTIPPLVWLPKIGARPRGPHASTTNIIQSAESLAAQVFSAASTAVTA